MKRYGIVTGVRLEKLAAYKGLDTAMVPSLRTLPASSCHQEAW
jgi:hypothetical protein